MNQIVCREFILMNCSSCAYCAFLMQVGLKLEVQPSSWIL